MAGIGFLIQKLVKKDDLTSIFCGYLISSLITTGPWLFTILALGGIAIFGAQYASLDQMAVIRLIIIYNFSFSLVIAGPVTMVVTRYISDKIYQKDIKEIPCVLLGSLSFLFIVQVPLVYYFYFHYLDVEFNIALAGFFNYFLISGIWLVSVFLSTLKKYGIVSFIFALGMVIAVLAAIFLAKEYSQLGVLGGFNIGLGFILFSFLAWIFTEIPYYDGHLFGYLGYFGKFWDLLLAGLFYNMAIWADKWIMWFSPEGELLPNGFITYPNYDTAMFIAYLSIVPSMAIFFVNVEVTFYEKYSEYFHDIKNHATFKKIKQSQQGIIQNLFECSRNLIIFQGVTSLLIIFLAPSIFESLSISYLLLGMFRIGVLGAFFHVFTLFIFIILFYFDFRRAVLKLSLLFLLTNIVFTFAVMNMDFIYYGYGYFISSFFTFIVSLSVILYYLKTMPYQTFIKNNPGCN